MANVTVIPATRNIHTGIRKDAVTKRKTAGYALSAQTARSS